jgi:hypothetical protein
VTLVELEIALVGGDGFAGCLGAFPQEAISSIAKKKTELIDRVKTKFPQFLILLIIALMI